MPKKRKVDMDENEEKKDSLETAEDIEVKTERLSQEEVKGTSPPPKEDGKQRAGRNLRPRKSTCYAEKDSPEVDFEEKQKKIPRRKRRSEDGNEEKDPKLIRTDKGNDELITTPADAQVPSDMLQEDSNLPPPPPTLVACSTLNSEEEPVVEKPVEENKTEAIVSSSGGDQLSKTIEKKRPKKKPKPKINSTEKLPIDQQNIVPKTEPVSPSVAHHAENKENREGSGGENKQDEPLVIAPKPKPKKRIRKKPTVPPAASKVVEQSLEIKSNNSGEEPVVKQETEETDEQGKKETSDGDSHKEQEKKEDGEEKIKSVVTAAPKKRPPKRKPKPQVKSDPEKADSDKTDNGSVSKDCNGIDQTSEGEGNKGIKLNENSDKPTATSTAPKKRVKSRPKKPAASTKPATENDAADKPGVKKEGEEENQQDGIEGKKKSPGCGNEATTASVPVAALIRKPFFRGRRSKSISARSGRKEIIHQDEAIDPLDLRGFEHVEKYVTPPGVRLPKFWDSEDEMSEDENNDNFRRIMCGFGTNCRIHEVIRPASEIVRRLKELQNTFGATKSLPLFQKVEGSESNDDLFITDSGEPFFRKNRPIVWHTDPSFFKYANNYPSKCK